MCMVVERHIVYHAVHAIYGQWHRRSVHWLQRLQIRVYMYFTCACTRIIIHVMHDSNKHASNASCAARESFFLCDACKLTAVFCQRRIKAYNEKASQQNMIKRVDTKIFCQVFTYPYSRWHFHRINWMTNTIMAQGLDSTGTNNLTCLVAQCTHVLYHKAQLLEALAHHSRLQTRRSLFTIS